MSLGVTIKGPEGVVIGADSRVTLQAQAGNAPPIVITFDNATKLLSFSGEQHRFVGAVSYGAAVIGLRTAHSLIPEFEIGLPSERLTVDVYAQRLSDFFMGQWGQVMPTPYVGPDMTFIVSGYDEGAPYGRVFNFGIPSSPVPVERNPGDEFGMTWGGQLEIASRIIHGFDPKLPGLVASTLNLNPAQQAALRQALQQLELQVPYQVLPLQDCVNLALYMIRATVAAQTLAITVRGVGGPVELAVITRTEGLRFIQQKALQGEAGEPLVRERKAQ